MSKRRLFIGCAVSSVVQQRVLEWRRLHARLPARFTTPKNLHITIVPPWEETDETTIKQTISQLTLPVTGPLEFIFNWVCFGPDPAEPRLIWAEGEVSPGFAELKYRLEESLWLPHDKRPLRPHLTIARFHPEDFRRFPQKTLGEAVTWTETAEKFSLFESRLGRGGADYTPIADWPLK